MKRLKDQVQDQKKEYELLKEHAKKLEKKEFLAGAAIPWEEMTPDAWAGAVETVRQPGEGNQSRPFFVKLHGGSAPQLSHPPCIPIPATGSPHPIRDVAVERFDPCAAVTVLKFMKRGCSAPVQVADQLLRFFGVRCPGLRFILPTDDEAAEIQARYRMGTLRCGFAPHFAHKLHWGTWAQPPSDIPFRATHSLVHPQPSPPPTTET